MTTQHLKAAPVAAAEGCVRQLLLVRVQVREIGRSFLQTKKNPPKRVFPRPYRLPVGSNPCLWSIIRDPEHFLCFS
ncbi:hypothetical protein EMIT0194MI4_50026 [Pseudomonas sp. IT-194MI4]